MKIIAEIGSNVKVKLEVLESIKLASQAGADVVKFQLYNKKELCGFGSEVDLIDRSWFDDMRRCAQKNEIELMCTAFSPSGYEFVNQYVDTHKIASAEITDMDILKTVNSFEKPVLLSTGGATNEQIKDALLELMACDVTILYCVTEYPARVVDFRHMTKLKESFPDFQIGYSDHSIDCLIIPEMAKTLGASVIEKHVNLVGVKNTPDAPHSLNLDEFSLMCQNLKGYVSPLYTKETCSWQRVKTDAGYFRP